MKKLILFGILMFTLISVAVALEICEFEEDPYPSCRIITPAGMTCSTYNLFHPDNSTNISDGAMGVVNADAGIYSVVFNGSDSGGWSIQLCDNSTAYLNVKTTDETDLTTILANQVTIDSGITAVSSDMGANFTNQSDDRRIQINNLNETHEQIITHGDANWAGVADNSTIGAIYDRVMGVGIGTLIYDLLAELVGGYF